MTRLVLSAVLILFCLGMTRGAFLSEEHLMKRLSIRSVPKGVTFDSFMKTCESCGALYGKGITYKCVTDGKFKTYYECEFAVHAK